MYKRYRKIIAISDKTAEALVNYLGCDDRICVVENGIDIARIARAKAIEKKESFTIRYSETFDTVMAYYAVSIKNSVGEEYILRTASEYSKELLQIREFLLIITML